MMTTFSSIPEWDESGWRDRAACRDSDPDLFFPVGSGGPALEQIRVAKALCSVCPVRALCLQFALDTNQDAGIWGGTAEDERRRLRRERVVIQRQTLVLQ